MLLFVMLSYLELFFVQRIESKQVTKYNFAFCFFLEEYRSTYSTALLMAEHQIVLYHHSTMC
ncbi:MAG: hypothetical protein ACI8W0_002132 [Flavobacterium sp.]